jgi:hypothetical protein
MLALSRPIFEIECLDRDAWLSSGVQLGSQARESVEFGVSISNIEGELLSERTTVVHPGESGELSLEFKEHVDAPVHVSIFTRMAGPTGSSAYAWARFLSPRLTGPVLEAA